ncbi:MAG: S1/P1 nuclease [Formivibrio sp.]|nr:S1/P1 nuclease [Formivibrio sp.]
MKQIILLIAILALLSTEALAWSHQGHAMIADLASANLTPAARNQVRELLRGDLDANGNPSGRTTLAEISSWPDEIRTLANNYTFRGWHSRANPVCNDRLGACKNGHCVDQIIIDQTAILKDRTQPQRARNEALKWIVHLVGDLHMPLHSGSNGDGGGNIPVTLVGLKSGKNPTLHEVWDNELLLQALKRGPISVPVEPTTTLAADAPTQWMLEARNMARHDVYDPLPGFICGSNPAIPIVLDKTYQEKAFPVIRDQIGKAAARLAQLLNESLR